jgi:hypothetical protein
MKGSLSAQAKKLGPANFMCFSCGDPQRAQQHSSPTCNLVLPRRLGNRKRFSDRRFRALHGPKSRFPPPGVTVRIQLMANDGKNADLDRCRNTGMTRELRFLWSLCAEPPVRIELLNRSPRVRIELLNRSWSRRRTSQELRNHIPCNSLVLPRFAPRCAQNVPSREPRMYSATCGAATP